MSLFLASYLVFYISEDILIEKKISRDVKIDFQEYSQTFT